MESGTTIWGTVNLNQTGLDQLGPTLATQQRRRRAAGWLQARRAAGQPPRAVRRRCRSSLYEMLYAVVAALLVVSSTVADRCDKLLQVDVVSSFNHVHARADSNGNPFEYLS